MAEREERAQVLGRFSAPTRDWFAGAFAGPTAAQEGAWDSISSGENTLVVAPTGSGKTLSAFLWSIDRLARQGREKNADAGVKVLYISPLKALGVDVERNLRAPLAGIAQSAARLGASPPGISVGVRSGDTPPAERRRLVANPPDILITTPESLYLMLTSGAAATLAQAHTVIVDEIHALAADKRGAHLALSLERLDALLAVPAQRIGLSATVRPVDEVARFLGGSRPVTVVSPPSEKRFDLTVEVPVEDMSNPPVPEEVSDERLEGEHRAGSMWPSIERSLYERIVAERSTIVFANSRRLAERLTNRLNELHEEHGEDETPIARSHHGSVSKEQRRTVEEALKTGELRCVVATSSLELGIDMGLVDLVVQIDAPPSVASGLQRIGRAGHQVGGVSRAVLYPTHRASLLETAAVAERMLSGEIERLHIPANPLDVLAQHTIAAASTQDLEVESWFETVRRAAPFHTLPRSAYEATLDLVSGKYPSSEFAELRPRVVWDRTAGTLSARPGAQRLAIMSGGTIPDRGLFRVVAVGEEDAGTRVGELDEEMVYESRVGDVFTLGATSWRIREITHERVNVVPAFGAPGRMPFWRGDSAGRPAELGAALGALVRDLDEALQRGGNAQDSAEARLRVAGLDEFAVANTLAYLSDQREAANSVPSDRSITVERTKDEVGDWRLLLESPFGMAVHAPWALAVSARARERFGIEGSAVASNNGIILRLPDADGDPPGAELFLFDPGEIADIVSQEVTGSALFAARFRECAARSLILGGGPPGSRSPLWQQRQRSARLLEIAARYPDFPVVLEAVRECLQDVYDVEALETVLKDVGTHRIRVHEVAPELPSPFARAMLFGYVGEFIYEGDAPLGERRIAALSVDPELLRELLGEVELRELLDPDANAQVEAELQHIAPARRLQGLEGAADLLRILGPLTADDAAERLTSQHGDSLTAAETVELMDRLVAERRAIAVRVAQREAYAAIEDAGLLQDALGTALPPGVPEAFTAPRSDPLRQLLLRFAATRGPFTAAEAAEAFGLGEAVVRSALERLGTDGLLVIGRFRPGAEAGHGKDAPAVEWVHREVLRRLRSRSLAVLRGSVEPVPQAAFAAFLPAWQNCDGSLRGAEGLLTVVEQLAGLPVPASALETLILPQRISDYSPALLDELLTAGEIVWAGEGGLPGNDGRISLHLAEALDLTLRARREPEASDPLSESIASVLEHRGAVFATSLQQHLAEEGLVPSTPELVEALWSLVWSGRVTSDALGPLRAMIAGRRAAQKTRAARPRARSVPRGSFASLRTAHRAQASSRGILISAEPRLAGRWSLLPEPDPALPARLTTEAALLLDRYGVVTRGSVTAEGLEGGFARAYGILAELERSGHCRRGYLVDGLGGAQFAAPPTVDRLREFSDQREERLQRGSAMSPALTLSATDPANAYGAALPWPEHAVSGTRRPRRNPGALIVLAEGRPVLYLERGGRTAITLLPHEDDGAGTSETVLRAAAESLVETARSRRLESFTLEKIDGNRIVESPWHAVLRAAGFEETPRGLVLRREMR